MGIAHTDPDRGRRHGELLGHDQPQRGAGALARLDLAGERGHRAVGADMYPGIVLLGDHRYQAIPELLEERGRILGLVPRRRPRGALRRGRLLARRRTCPAVSRWPAAAAAGVMHDVCERRPISPVRAPQASSPQPSFGPGIARSSRSPSRRPRPWSADTGCSAPLTMILISM